MIALAIAWISIFMNIPSGHAAVMEAVIQIESDNFRMTSFLERFKQFVARSHWESSFVSTESQMLQKFVHQNETFQASYDFSRNFLTMSSTYSLLLNGTDQKISDVKIVINFGFNHETNERIMVKDLHPRNSVSEIEHTRDRQCDAEWCDSEYRSKKSEGSTILGKLLSPIVDVIEPIIIAFIHIVVNGVLGHVLATAFEHLYNGRLISI